MTLFLREDSRKTPASKRPCNSPAESGSVDDASEICFSLDRSDPCAFGVTVQSAESCEISGPLCTVQPMETCETLRIDPPVPPPYPRTLFWLSSACYTLFGQDGVWWCDFEAGGDMPVFSPVPPPAPSSAGLRFHFWRSSVVEENSSGDYYIPTECQAEEELDDDDEDEPFCGSHRVFFSSEIPDIYGHSYCSPYEFFFVYPPVPPIAPSSAGLLRRDWKSSVLQCDSEYYIPLSCLRYEDSPIWKPFPGEVADSDVDFDSDPDDEAGFHAYCQYHRKFHLANLDFDDDYRCDDDDYYWEVPKPAPMTKEQLKNEFPSYLNAWSTHIDGFRSNALSTVFFDWLNSRGLSFEALQVPIPPPCPSKPLTGHCSIGYKLTLNKKTGFLLFLARPHEGDFCFCPREPTKWWYDV